MFNPAFVKLRILQGSGFAVQLRFRPDAKRVVACSNAINPTVTVDAPHGLTTGQTVLVTGIKGAWGLNGSWVVASVPSVVSMVLTIATAPGVFEASEDAWVGRLFDLTGYSGRMKFRGPDGTELLSLTSGAGLTFGGAAGTVDIARTPAQTAALTWQYADYDLESFTAADAIVERLAYGWAVVVPEQTR